MPPTPPRPPFDPPTPPLRAVSSSCSEDPSGHACHHRGPIPGGYPPPGGIPTLAELLAARRPTPEPEPALAPELLTFVSHVIDGGLRAYSQMLDAEKEADRHEAAEEHFLTMRQEDVRFAETKAKIAGEALATAAELGATPEQIQQRVARYREAIEWSLMVPRSMMMPVGMPVGKRPNPIPAPDPDFVPAPYVPEGVVPPARSHEPGRLQPVFGSAEELAGFNREHGPGKPGEPPAQ